jgi:hypothetical protein
MTVEQAREALQRHLDNNGHGEATRIAKLCGVDPGLPGRWARGERTPDADGGSREVLETETGIPASAWRRRRAEANDTEETKGAA